MTVKEARKVMHIDAIFVKAEQEENVIWQENNRHYPTSCEMFLDKEIISIKPYVEISANGIEAKVLAKIKVEIEV